MQATATTAPRGMSYAGARRLIVIAGLVLLAVTAAIMYARRVDTAEVVAILLFIPVFLAFIAWDIKGGVAAALVASAVYAAVRWPAIDAVGVGEFSGLLLSRGLAFLAFGAAGGWADRQLEQSLEKLELYDQIDDDTGLYNARFFLQDTDLELARAERYQTMFSVAHVAVPASAFEGLGRRRRAALLRELGAQLRQSVRSVDRVVHATDDRHHVAVICPETGPEGVRVFTDRLAASLGTFLADRGARLDPGSLAGTALTVPGDEARLTELRDLYARIDEEQHA